MSALIHLWNRTLAFFRKQPLDADFDAEMAAHLEFAVEENMRHGMTENEARRQALIRFGGKEQMKQTHRETRGLASLDILLQDLRFALRTLRKDYNFTIVAVLILALGIGANIAVFSVVNTLLLRPLPFQSPEQLLWIAPPDATGLSGATYSSDAFRQLEQQNRSYQSVTGYYAFSSPENLKLMGHGAPIPATAIMVAENFFQTLGVQPMMGRLYTHDEAVHGARVVMLLSYNYWRRQFASDPAIVGKVVDFNNTPVTIIGVLPETFDFGSAFAPGTNVDAFQAITMGDISDEGNTLSLIGRLKSGVTVAQAQNEAKTLFPKFLFSFKYANSAGDYTARPFPLKEYISGKLRRSLIVLWSSVGLILLIVCVNLSNLLLARAAARNKEFSLRTALGAGRGRLIRQILTESFVLSGFGAVLGLILAYTITTYLAHQDTLSLPLLRDVRLDGTALAWTLLITVGTAAFFGLFPALRISSGDLQAELKDTGMGLSEGRSHERMRSLLVISEVALACVLLVGAGLLLRSFIQVMDVDLGFQPTSAFSISVDDDPSVTQDDYKNNTARDKHSVYFQNLQQKIAALPGIESVGISDNLPFSRNRSWGSISIKGHRYEKGELPETLVYVVTPGYLRTMGMRLHGRDVAWSDQFKSEKVMVITQSAARYLFPNQDPLNRLAQYGGSERRIVGVIDDVHESNLETPGSWQVFLPVAQAGFDGAHLILRSKLPPSTLAPSVMGMLRQINPGQPNTELRPLTLLVDRAVSPRKFFVLLVGTFAALGLILASLGIFGVISYNVTRQTKEIGIRMALGASAQRVQKDVVVKTVTMVSYGIIAGLIASYLVAKAISSLLYQTAPTDILSFVCTVLLLTAVALLASYLPARRASRIDPMQALRTN